MSGWGASAGAVSLLSHTFLFGSRAMSIIQAHLIRAIFFNSYPIILRLADETASRMNFSPWPWYRFLDYMPSLVKHISSCTAFSRVVKITRYDGLVHPLKCYCVTDCPSMVDSQGYLENVSNRGNFSWDVTWDQGRRRKELYKLGRLSWQATPLYLGIQPWSH